MLMFNRWHDHLKVKQDTLEWHLFSLSIHQQPDHLFNSFFQSNQKKTSEFHITGGRLNKEEGLTRYGNSHVKDKTS